MGCDIHVYTEVFDKGEWKTADEWVKERAYTGLMNEYSYVRKEVYDGRNYTLFGFLANVRQNWQPTGDGSSHGFGGSDTGEAVKPIDMPRGLPDDVCDRVRKTSDAWGPDGHSHSWFTLKELLEADWDQIKTNRGMVTPEQAEEFKKNGTLPDTWCAWTSQKDAVQIEWTWPLRDVCDEFINGTIPKLQELGEPDKVRIVFWFDN